MSTHTAPRLRTRTRTFLAGLMASLVVVAVFAAFPRGAQAGSLPQYRVKFEKFAINNDMDGFALGCGEFSYQRMNVAMPMIPQTSVDKDLCEGQSYYSFMGSAQTSGWFPMVYNQIPVGYYFQEDDVIQVDEGGGKTTVTIPEGATKVPFLFQVYEYGAQVQNMWDSDPRVGEIRGYIEISY